MVAVPVLSASIVRVTLGNLFQSVDGRRLALLGISISAIPSLILLFPIVPTYSLLLMLGVLLGVGGASFAIALPMAGSSYPPQVQGLVLGLAAAGNIGAVVDGFVFPTLAQHYGWQRSTAAVLPLLALTAAAVMLWAEDRSAKSGSACARIRRLRGVAAERHGAGVAGERRIVRTRKDGALLLPVLGAAVALAVLPRKYLAVLARARYLGRHARVQHHLRRVRRHVLLREPAADDSIRIVRRWTPGMIMAALSFTGAMVRPVGGLLADRLSGVKVLLVLLLAIALCNFGFAALMPPLTGARGAAGRAVSVLRPRQRRDVPTGAASLEGQDGIDDRHHRCGRRHRWILSAGRHGHGQGKHRQLPAGIRDLRRPGGRGLRAGRRSAAAVARLVGARTPVCRSISRSRPPNSDMQDASMKLIVIGNGMVGQRLLERLQARAP